MDNKERENHGEEFIGDNRMPDISQKQKDDDLESAGRTTLLIYSVRQMRKITRNLDFIILILLVISSGSFVFAMKFDFGNELWQALSLIISGILTFVFGVASYLIKPGKLAKSLKEELDGKTIPPMKR